MSHQAIARKWRPKTFEEIEGQRHVTRTLQNAISLDKVHHAFLLTGARGVGKTSAARILARTLNCERRGQTDPPNPCNECGSCTEMLAGSFPDVIEFDAASHNSVDDIRDLVDKVRYTPQKGRHKVYIIDEVHMVTKQGFNALLKTLEEPPPHVVFILATTDPQQLLDTVISRCQRFDFKMIPVRTVYDLLQRVSKAEGVSIPDSSLMTIAREGGGSMRDAQSLLDQVLSFSGDSVTEAEVADILGFIDRSILYDLLEACLNGDAAGALEAAAKVSRFGFDVRTFANQLLEAVRNVTVCCEIRDAASLLDLPDDEITRLQELAQGRDRTQLQQQFDLLVEAVDSIARSEQPQLLLDMAAVKMASVRPVLPVMQMIERLEQLERRLMAGGPPPSRGPTGGGRRFEPPRRQPRNEPPPRRAEPPPRRAEPPPEPPRRAEAPRPAAPPPEPPRRAEPPRPAAPPPPKAEAAPPPPAPEPPKAPPTPAADAPAPPQEAAAVTARLLGYKRSGGPKADAAPRRSAAPPKPPKAAPPPKAAAPEPPPPKAAPPPETAPPKAAAAPPSPEPEAPKRKRRAPKPAGPPAIPKTAESEELSLANLFVQHLGEVERSPLDPARPDPTPGERCDGKAWRRFVHGLKDAGPIGPLRAALSFGGFVKEDGDALVIGFGTEMPLRQSKAQGHSPILEAALGEAFGKGTTLQFELDSEGHSGRSLAEEIERVRAERRKTLEAKARSHPLIEATESLFPGAQLVGVHVPELTEIDDVQ